MSEAADRRFMRIALREARRGRPSPNPHVGAAIVRDGVLVAVGHHAKAGQGHAEVEAIRAAGERARGATLYVTFEPCNHHGRTPPCTEAILAAGITRVVVGCRDPHPHVAGATARLEANGIEVVHGVCEADAQWLVAPFAKHISTGRPFVAVKAAVTLDGRMSTSGGDSKWITGERARREVHAMRSRADAVLVGVGTVLADDPELTVRHVEGVNPTRIVVDSRLRTPPTAKICDVSVAPTLIFHGPGADASALAATGVTLVELPLACGAVDLGAMLDALGRRDVVHLMVEGGPKLIDALMRRALVDRVSAFVAPVLLGDAGAPGLSPGKPSPTMSAALRLADVRVRRFGPDALLEGHVRPLDHAGAHGYVSGPS